MGNETDNEYDDINDLLYGTKGEHSSEPSEPSKGLTIVMTLDRPAEEGGYFVQYHRNFQPVYCDVYKKEDGKLWLDTRTTSKPLSEIKAYCFSERL